MEKPIVILSIAGSDSGAGAGIQADIKTVMSLGGYATCAVSALTAQNTLGVSGVWPTAPDALTAQVRAVLNDFDVAAIKTGLLIGAEQIAAVHDVLATVPQIPLVIDPVLKSSSGTAFDDAESRAALCRLLPRAHVVTPNVREALALTGETDPNAAAFALLSVHGARAVLLTGGDTPVGEECVDLLVSAEHTEVFRHARVKTQGTHGTGCTLSSALALFLARGASLSEACASAIDYTVGALEAAPGLGRGRGPLGHAKR